MKLSNPRLLTIASSSGSKGSPASATSIMGSRRAGVYGVRSRRTLPMVTFLIIVPPQRCRPNVLRLDYKYLQPPPHPLNQPLDRPEARLVGHLAALPDPVAEIQIRKLQLQAALNLPQDVVRAVARTLTVGIVERVYRRETIVQAVDETHDPQSAIL